MILLVYFFIFFSILFSTAPAENIKVALLEKENRALQKQLTCRVCKQAPIKELFLPCGDLYACEECSKSLSHCPACNKQILATVKTYFVWQCVVKDMMVCVQKSDWKCLWLQFSFVFFSEENIFLLYIYVLCLGKFFMV